MPSVGVNQIKRGDAIDFKGGVYVCVGFEHVKPGKGPAYVQMKLKDVQSGRVIDNRFRSADAVDKVDYDRRECNYSYRNGDTFVFMNNENYEEVEVHAEVIGEDEKYLIEGDVIILCMVKDKVLGYELPKSIVVEVVDTEPGIKNASATNVGKPATCSTGLVVLVPPFINQGEKIKVSTEDGTYLERVNS